MKSLKQQYTINAPIAEVWKGLVNEKHIIAWGGGPTKMDDKINTKFKLWGGDIHGTNTEVIPEKKLVQDWYGGEWAEPSKVTFLLKKKDDHVILTLHHENVPDTEFNSIEKGWADYYIGPMKKYLEADQ